VIDAGILLVGRIFLYDCDIRAMEPGEIDELDRIWRRVPGIRIVHVAAGPGAAHLLVTTTPCITTLAKDGHDRRRPRRPTPDPWAFTFPTWSTFL
jgi:hypothetical protein